MDGVVVDVMLAILKLEHVHYFFSVLLSNCLLFRELPCSLSLKRYKSNIQDHQHTHKAQMFVYLVLSYKSTFWSQLIT